MKKILILVSFFTSLAIINISYALDQVMQTNVISVEKAKTQTFDWGTLITYYQGDTETTVDALSAIAIINPGMEIHPPHKHAEEEYLLVLEGSGVWTVKNKDIAANAGDMLYAKPWDLHGIKNTGNKPLKFAVFKWGVK